MGKPKNDRSQAVTKFCLAMEEHRRTDAGRVRTAKEFVSQFFAHDQTGAKDRLFLHMPNDVRGPVLSAWGIRGAKAALRDDDERVRDVVYDALVAGDIDEAIFEDGVTAQILVDWIALGEWWTFWRNGKLSGVAIQKALATARELGLIDDKWFLLNVQGRGGRLKGTDVLCDTLSKDQIVAWIRKLHETGDGSPAGIIAAIGWETVLAKTAQDALLFALDQFAKKAGLVVETTTEKAPPSQEVTTPRHPPLSDQHPTMSVPGPAVDAKAEAESTEKAKRDSGFPVAIPDIPAIDSMPPRDPSADEDDPSSIPSIPSVQERSVWGAPQAPAEESPKLAEARAKMMAMLDKQEPIRTATASKAAEWNESEVPAKPSSLEWPEPPPIGSSHEEPPGDGPHASAPNAKIPAPNPPPLPKRGPAPRPR